MDDVAVYIGQAMMAALEFVRQSFMIHAQAVQHRGMQVVDVYRVLDDVKRKIVARTVGQSWLNSPSSHPNTETAWVVVATISFHIELPLGIDRTSEFATPDYQRLVKHPALFEVGNQRRGALINIAAL